MSFLKFRDFEGNFEVAYMHIEQILHDNSQVKTNEGDMSFRDEMRKIKELSHLGIQSISLIFEDFTEALYINPLKKIQEIIESLQSMEKVDLKNYIDDRSYDVAIIYYRDMKNQIINTLRELQNCYSKAEQIVINSIGEKLVTSKNKVTTYEEQKKNHNLAMSEGQSADYFTCKDKVTHLSQLMRIAVNSDTPASSLQQYIAKIIQEIESKAKTIEASTEINHEYQINMTEFKKFLEDCGKTLNPSFTHHGLSESQYSQSAMKESSDTNIWHAMHRLERIMGTIDLSF